MEVLAFERPAQTRRKVVAVKSWLAPRLLPAIQLLSVIQLLPVIQLMLDMLVEVVRVEEVVVEL